MANNSKSWVSNGWPLIPRIIFQDVTLLLHFDATMVSCPCWVFLVVCCALFAALALPALVVELERVAACAYLLARSLAILVSRLTFLARFECLTCFALLCFLLSCFD